VIGVDGASITKEVLLTRNLQSGRQCYSCGARLSRRTPQALEVKKQNNELQQAFGTRDFQQFILLMV
jgi:phosphoenolpyruvate carboxylase